MAKHARGPRKPEKNWSWNPPRRVHMIDASRVLTIRRTETSGWRVENGLGIIVKSGFESNRAAWQWVATHNTDRAAKGRSPRGV